MKQFVVKLEIPATITKTITVEAEDAKQAEERAMGFMNDVGQDHVLNSNESSDWSDQDYENRRVVGKPVELDENGSPIEEEN
jgi:hypothetical protein